ncbi:MAG TPA: 2OG-Fe(II) oxygenase family protein [Candidatus Polarisedimenticolaceae bacterium]|nr:2OG-Fe(II) oxygenase family protein [Candidatus Polarisedimenticolaceae bacterium]
MSNRKDDGVRAVNRDFSRYDQVDKSHTYRLAGGTPDEYDESFVLPICDIGQLFEGGADGRQSFAEQLGGSLERIGFACIHGHGIDPVLWNQAEARVIDLFTRPSLDDKLRFRAARHGSVNQGYFPIKETSEIHPDLVEGWVFCRRAFDLDGDPGYDASRFWALPEHEPHFRRIVEANERLILPLTQAIFRYLGCDPHLYDEKLTGTNIGLRLNYYPPIRQRDEASGAGRLLGHEDVDLFTLLPAPRVEGLEAWNRASGRWVRLDAPPGSLILNTGDYMQRITNDRLRSTTHRVSQPRDESQRGTTRVSIPMAVYLAEDELLEVLPGLGRPRYEPIMAITFHTRSTSKFYGDGYAVD